MLKTTYKQTKKVVKTFLEEGLNLMILGRPGTGKTSIVQEVAKEMQMELIMFHPTVDEPVDYKGYPTVINGTATFLPYDNLQRIIEAKEPTIAFFDDFTHADIDVQKSIMQLIWGRNLNERKISKHVKFVFAGNGLDDNSAANPLIEPIKQRMAAIIEMTVSSEEWVNWALENNINYKVIQYVRFDPSVLEKEYEYKLSENSPSPRTLYFLSRIVDKWETFDENTKIALSCGAIGKEYGTKFIQFSSVYSEMPKIDEVFESPQIIKKILSEGKMDLVYALCGNIIQYTNEKNIEKFYDVCEMFEDKRHFQIMMVRDLCMKLKHKFINHKKTLDFAKENAKVFLYDE